MKELTIEQKVRAYDKAVKEAFTAYKDEDKHLKETLERIFPELKESEDERIRKALTEFLKSASGGFLDTSIKCKTYGKWVVWLEKQDNFSKKDVDNAYLKGVADTKNEIEKQYEANYQIRKDIATFIFNYKGDIKDRAKWMNYLGINVSFVKKQGEKPQGKSALEAIREEKVDNANKIEPKDYSSIDPYFGKPIDKVEPKFHKDEWTVSNLDRKARQISEVHFDEYNSYYVVDGKEFNLEEYDRLHHSWTIKDANAGDVLVDAYGNIGVYMKCNAFYWISYFSLGCNGGFRCFSITHENEKSFPATKEQRELLSQKMKEVGYEWDANKKELIKEEVK